MAAIAFPSLARSGSVPSGTTYSFVHTHPKDNKPYILFLHGFPDSSYGWRHQIPYFLERGYGLIVPDLLGYGGTDKPKELEAYRLKKMAQDLIGFLDAYQIQQVIGVGHDWGSSFLSRLACYHPERFSKYAFLDVAYAPPRGRFSVDAVNEQSEKLLGYPVFGYWHFFNEPNAGELMDQKPASMTSLLFPADPTSFKENLCLPNAARAYITSGTTQPLASWITPSEISTYNEIFAPENGGYGPPTNWYKAQIANLNTADEAEVPEERYHIQVPALLVTCAKDYIAVPKMQEGLMRPWVEDLVVKELDSGHFVQAEKADEVNKALEEFIEK